jgi:hypothetical protein
VENTWRKEVPVDLSLTMDELEGFLQENADKSIGSPKDSYYCPIANYFKDKRGIPVGVGTCRIAIDQRVTGYEKIAQDRPTDDWENDFVLLLDEKFADYEFVYGQDALVVLEEIREWYVND